MKNLKAKILVRSISVTAAILLLLTTFLVIMSCKNTLTTLDKTMKETTEVAALQIETRLGTSKNALMEIGTIEKLSDSSIFIEEKQAILTAKRDTYDFKSLSLAYCKIM